MKKISGEWLGWKRVTGMVVAIFVLAGVIWWTNLIPILNHRYQVYKVLSGVENLKQAYREDTYGGATPEETLAMFIEAFKAGDLDLASKYFVIEKQAEYLAKMQNWVKLGKVEEIVGLLEQAKWSGNSKTNQDQMDVWGEERESQLSIFFIWNEYSKKWKLNNM